MAAQPAFLYQIVGTPKAGPGGLLWAEVLVEDQSGAQSHYRPVSLSQKTQARPRSIASAPAWYSVRAPVVDGKPLLPRIAETIERGERGVEPLDHSLGGCTTGANYSATAGSTFGLEWETNGIVMDPNGQPDPGPISWSSPEFNVPITGSAPFNPPTTPNNAMFDTTQSFTIVSNPTVGVYQYSVVDQGG